MPLRILHISTRLILGGSQENTVLSCEGQARLGHEVHLAFGPIYGPEGSLLERVERFRTPDGRGITTHVVPHLVRAVRPYSDQRACDELGRLILRLKPDVVHTHSSKAGVLGRAAAWGVRRLCAYGHEPPAHTPSPHALHSTPGAGTIIAGGGRAWRAGGGCLPAVVHTIHGPPFMPVEGGPARRAKVRLNNWVYTRAERYAARRCDLIVSVADAMTRQFLARGIGRPEQYVTVRSGMETGPYLTPGEGESRDELRESLGLAPDDFVVGTVARLAEHKGHDDLLDALKDVRDRRVYLLWVGDGWWKSRLAARAQDMYYWVVEHRPRPDGGTDVSLCAKRPPDRAYDRPSIVLTGLVPPERIPAMIRAMDVLAHPSYREGLPRTVPQALLSSVMPIAYDCDGTGEICRDMETGRLVRTGDVDGLREAVLWAMSHPAERAALAARGREEVAREYSAEKMVADLEGVYARALALARGRAASAGDAGPAFGPGNR